MPAYGYGCSPINHRLAYFAICTTGITRFRTGCCLILKCNCGMLMSVNLSCSRDDRQLIIVSECSVYPAGNHLDRKIRLKTGSADLALAAVAAAGQLRIVNANGNAEHNRLSAVHICARTSECNFIGVTLVNFIAYIVAICHGNLIQNPSICGIKRKRKFGTADTLTVVIADINIVNGTGHWSFAGIIVTVKLNSRPVYHVWIFRSGDDRSCKCGIITKLICDFKLHFMCSDAKRNRTAGNEIACNLCCSDFVSININCRSACINFRIVI